MALITPSGGSGGNVVLFDSVLSGTQATIDTGANGIPSGFRHLEVFLLLRTNEAVVGSNTSINVNGDSSAIYDTTLLSNVNATVTGATQISQTAWSLTTAGASALASEFMIGRMWLPYYTETVAFKGGFVVFAATDTTGNNNRIKEYGLGYRSSSAITRMAFTPTTGGSLFIAGTHITIYGVN